MDEDLIKEINDVCTERGWKPSYFARKCGHGRLMEYLEDPEKEIMGRTRRRVKDYIAKLRAEMAD